jgi:hypothetical protein
MLIRTIALTAVLATLVGCASQTAFQPAEKRGAEGYTETKLTDNRYRVTFTGNSVTPAETVQDYALLRAAELTLQEGYDWFQLVGRETDKKARSSTTIGGGMDFPSQTQVYQRCGLLRCDTVVSSSPGFSSGADIATTNTSTSYSSALEIVLGKYPLPNSVESYDARQLASTLRRLMNRPK